VFDIAPTNYTYFRGCQQGLKEVARNQRESASVNDRCDFGMTDTDFVGIHHANASGTLIEPCQPAIAGLSSALQFSSWIGRGGALP
jgi:hypothetical protein